MAQPLDLQLFVAVVREGSFTAAAGALGVSKSFVSNQIRRLEERLGARLLSRTTRSVSLTPIGQAFFERASSIVDQIHEAEQTVRMLHDEPVGRLRVSAPLSYGTRVLAPLLAEFLSVHPKLEAELELSDRMVDLVAEEVDLTVRVTSPVDSSYYARKLCPVRAMWCASPPYLAANGRPEHPSELRHHEVLDYRYATTGRIARFRNGQQRVSVKLSGRTSSNNGDVLAHCAAQGLGIAFLPEFIVCDLHEAGRLESVLDDWQLESHRGLAAWAMYPHSRLLTSKVRLLIDFLVERLSKSSG